MTKQEILNYEAVEPYIVFNNKAKTYGIKLMQEKEGDHIIVINSNSDLKSWLEGNTLRANFYKINDEEIKKINSNLLQIISDLSESSILKYTEEETEKLKKLIEERNRKIEKRNDEKMKNAENNNTKKFEKGKILTKFKFVFYDDFQRDSVTLDNVTFSVDEHTIRIYKNNKIQLILPTSAVWMAFPMDNDEEIDDEIIDEISE